MTICATQKKVASTTVNMWDLDRVKRTVVRMAAGFDGLSCLYESAMDKSSRLCASGFLEKMDKKTRSKKEKKWGGLPILGVCE